jgi:glycosyltransferase involved in cell wall biosynthesis
LTTAELADARNYGVQCPIAVIPNGVDTARYSGLTDPGAAFERWPSLKNKRIMLFLARIHPIKGLEPLVSAWAKVAGEHPDWALVIAGPDETGLKAKLEQIARGTGERTVFTGAVYGETKDALLAAAEVFTMPSYSEGFSNSILEALACGLPALISPQCNFPKVASAQAGWLVQPQEPAIETAMREMLGMSQAQLQTVGERGRTLVRQEYDWSAIAAMMKQVYQWLLGRGQQPGFVEFDGR